MNLHIEIVLSERDEADLETAWWTTRSDADIAALVLAKLSHHTEALVDALADLEHDEQWQPRRCPRCGEECANRYENELWDGLVWHRSCATDEGREQAKGLTEEVWA